MIYVGSGAWLTIEDGPFRILVRNGQGIELLGQLSGACGHIASDCKDRRRSRKRGLESDCFDGVILDRCGVAVFRLGNEEVRGSTIKLVWMCDHLLNERGFSNTSNLYTLRESR